jgi:hypothetical protein
MRTRLMQRLE